MTKRKKFRSVTSHFDRSAESANINTRVRFNPTFDSRIVFFITYPRSFLPSEKIDLRFTELLSQSHANRERLLVCKNGLYGNVASYKGLFLFTRMRAKHKLVVETTMHSPILDLSWDFDGISVFVLFTIKTLADPIIYRPRLFEIFAIM